MSNEGGGGALVVAAAGFQHNDDLPRGFDWRSYDAYLFDIDGTLLNCRDRVHVDSFCDVMREMFGREISLDGIPMQGSTDPLITLAALAQAGVSPEEGRAVLREATDRICAMVEQRETEMTSDVLPGVRKLLDELQSEGKLLGIASGNVERVGQAKLRAARLERYFQFGSYSDQRHSRAELFRWAAGEAQRRLGAQARICFLGDTPADVQSARACGAAVIAVATGIFPLLELSREAPDLCIPGCETLWRYARL